MKPTTDRVVLRGFSVPLAAVQVLWDLEARGFRLAATAAGLRVRPRTQITPADDSAIRAHRDVLIALLEYGEAVQ